MSKRFESSNRLPVVSANIRSPFTTEDYAEIDELCEVLLDACTKKLGAQKASHARHLTNDIMDILVDIKIDVKEFEEKNCTD